MSDIELYITQTRTYYPPQGDVEVHLYGRTPDGDADSVRVMGFEPYFYVPIDEADNLLPRDHSGLRRIEKETDIDGSLFGDELAKVVAQGPGDVPDLREQYDTTFEADVVFTNRLRIDKDIFTGVRVPSQTVQADEVEPADVDASPRHLYYDIEVDDRGSMPVQGGEVIHTDSEIVTICAYDTYTEQYHGFISLDGRQPAEAMPDIVTAGEPPGDLDKLHYAGTEKAMLKQFFKFIADTDPDVLLAWNNLGFDAPYLIERSNSLGLDLGKMARPPEPEATHNQYGPEITGRVVYDLMVAWERMQYTEVSSRLENAASMELGDDAGKIQHEETIYELWRDNVSKLLEYNARDVSLMVEINDAAGVMQDREELKDTVGVDYEDTYEASDFIEMQARRMLDEMNVAGPTFTGPPRDEDDDDYEGALTLSPFEGVEENVTSIDLASLYPMTMWMLNSSPETLVEVADDPDEVKPLPVDDEKSVAPNGAVFDRSEDGLFRKLVDKAMELTRQAARRRSQYSPSDELWDYWNSVRESRKRIRNGLYGVLGWELFFLYSRPVAESITTMAQEVIRTSKEYIEANTQGEVVYGDTDSCYISWPDDWEISECLEATSEVVEELNEDVYPELATEWGMPADECKWEIEMEDASERMFQAGKKKRYAKRVVWKEGMDFGETLDEPSVKIMGFEYKRSDTAALTAQLQESVLKKIVNGKPKSEIRSEIFDAVQQIERRYPDWDLIGAPSGIGKELDNYDSPTAAAEAAQASNELLDLGIAKGDKPKRVYIEENTLEHDGESVRTDRIAFNDGIDLAPIEDQLYVDVGWMRELLIEGPIGRIVEPVGIDIHAAMKGTRQNSLSDFV
mgnify:CR=1 FL=1